MDPTVAQEKLKLQNEVARLEAELACSRRTAGEREAELRRSAERNVKRAQRAAENGPEDGLLKTFFTMGAAKLELQHHATALQQRSTLMERRWIRAIHVGKRAISRCNTIEPMQLVFVAWRRWLHQETRRELRLGRTQSNLNGCTKRRLTA